MVILGEIYINMVGLKIDVLEKLTFQHQYL
jgi:hypothetical protein